MADDKGIKTIQLGFVSAALSDDDVRLEGVVGREAISQLYEFELLLVRPAGVFDGKTIDSLLEQGCAIGMGPDKTDVVHGGLSSIELLEAGREGGARYRARLVPNVSLLASNINSAIYQDTTVVDMVKTILQSYGLTDGEQFEITTVQAAKNPKREYVVQYQESDWDFIQRWLEHEGYFYWFEHGKEGEKLWITDDNETVKQRRTPPAIQWRDRNTLSTETNTLWDWRHITRRVPSQVALVEYNYRDANKVLVRTAKVDDRGFGTTIHYGEHFKDEPHGDALAKIRAERHQTERTTYFAETDTSQFRAGYAFELQGHAFGRGDDDSQQDVDKYLVTSIEHRVGHDPRGTGTEPQPYLAKLEAIPLSTPFRPERRTAWPRIHSIMHGHVDADGSGDYAQIDSSARYKVKLPFDLGTEKGMRASRWIRCAQPYTGPGYGMHFPLHKGTEVLISYIDGDPDRPIIVGSVTNSRTKGPVVDANATQAVVETASGVRWEMEDLQR